MTVQETDRDPALEQILARLSALEERVAPLSAVQRAEPRADDVTDGAGGVTIAGRVRLPDGREAVWEYGHTTAALLEGPWGGFEASLKALGHRHRLDLLRDLIDKPMTALQLAQTGRHGTTGQIYHHLRHLVDAGWLTAHSRGLFGVPVQRVVPLLAVLSACRGEL